MFKLKISQCLFLQIYNFKLDYLLHLHFGLLIFYLIMKILIVEDNQDLREIAKIELEKEGFVLEQASNYQEALEKIELYEYDCILLDIMLPDGDGLSLLRHLKKAHKTEGVIIISAKDSLDDKIEGLELGADDYLAKPFHFAELIARIKSVIRRKMGDGEMFNGFGDLKINLSTLKAYVNDKELVLSKKEFDILVYFSTRANRIIDKTTLAEGVWGDYIDQVDNYDFIYAQMKNIRKKLKEAGSYVEIKSIYGFGYKLINNELNND